MGVAPVATTTAGRWNSKGLDSVAAETVSEADTKLKWKSEGNKIKVNIQHVPLT